MTIALIISFGKQLSAWKDLKYPIQKKPPICNQDNYSWARSDLDKAEVFAAHFVQTFQTIQMPTTTTATTDNLDMIMIEIIMLVDLFLYTLLHHLKK